MPQGALAVRTKTRLPRRLLRRRLVRLAGHEASRDHVVMPELQSAQINCAGGGNVHLRQASVRRRERLVAVDDVLLPVSTAVIENRPSASVTASAMAKLCSDPRRAID